MVVPLVDARLLSLVFLTTTLMATDKIDSKTLRGDGLKVAGALAAEISLGGALCFSLLRQGIELY